MTNMSRTIPSVSVIIPAYNEAGNIAQTTHTVQEALREGGFLDYEILIFDDGSKDKTGEIADALHAEDLRVRVTHNRPNKGFGYNFQKGIEFAQKEYVGLIPGDNEISPESVRNIIAAVGDTDITNAYHATMAARSVFRRIISRTFTWLINKLFGLRLRYFNGPTFIRTKLLRAVPRTAMGFGFMMEILVPLVRAGYGVVEVPMVVQPRAYGAPTALRPKNIWRVVKLIFVVLFRVYFTRTIPRLRNI